ncbi:ribosome biogenesis factor YjgA [Candidatus Sororendozoicomonas aggregata]|uniref:ribosome biogenesis factor YjgA n=1 Tax=Candidatus Sororendozoicomonas aggregata TaxID=3073239 RepID=UPI002ED41567
MSSDKLPLEHPEDDEIIYVSKSEIKRDLHALKAMGARLMEMKPSLLDKLPLRERLRDALDESKRIKSHNARKRHLGFIGKLMQEQDIEPIEKLFAILDSTSEDYNRHFHQLERWRDRLIEEGQTALTDYLTKHPNADHQHIRQLVRNAKKDAEQNKPPATSRKLFRYLREVDEASINGT